MDEEILAPSIDLEDGRVVGGAVEEAIGVVFVGIDEGGAQGFGGVAEKFGFDAVGDMVGGAGMTETDFFGVEAESREIFAGVECVAEDRQAAVFGVDADLVGAAGERTRFDEVKQAMIAGDFAVVIELRFGRFAAGAADVTIAVARNTGLDSEFFLTGMFGGEEDVTLANFAIGELLGERLVGDFRFGENDEAGSGFIEAVNDGEIRPAGFAGTQPLV